MIKGKRSCRILLWVFLIYTTFLGGVDLSLATGVQELPTLSPIIKKSLPSIVSISVTGKFKNPNILDFNEQYEQFLKHFFGELHNFKQEEDKERAIYALGSGVIIDATNGYIVTNYHVIQNAEEIFVTLHNKKRVIAKLVGFDAAIDIAILQIKEKDITAIPIGNSDLIEIGDFVIAIGSPFGLSHTVSSGIISGTGRSNLGIAEYENLIQTDASINPGNSGGGLINLKGELIGINTAILTPNGTNIGIGFAIPSAMVQEVKEQIIKYGEIKRGQIGIHLQEVTHELKEALDLNVDYGAIISQVLPGSPAEKSGLKEGDVIIQIDGKVTKSASDVKNAVGLKQRDQEVVVHFFRNGNKMQKIVKIGGPVSVEQSLEIETGLLEGVTVSAIPEDHKSGKQLSGVLVTKLKKSALAWFAGLREHDIIIAVNQQKISNPEELLRAVKQKKDIVLLNVKRGNAALFITISKR